MGNITRKTAILLAIFMAASAVATGPGTTVTYAASTTAKKAARAYKSYHHRYLSSNNAFRDGQYTTHDINKDGIPEMIFSYASGVRGAYKIYTYRNKRVWILKTIEGCSGTMKYKDKCIFVTTSGSASATAITRYKISSNKLTKVSVYKSVPDPKDASIVYYYKNGKIISNETFNGYRNKINGYANVFQS